jgi:hypothetical protein
MNSRNRKPTSRLDAADDDVVDFIVSDLLVATSKNINELKYKILSKFFFRFINPYLQQH